MPTMTESQTETTTTTTADIADIVKALGIMSEEVERLANDALTDILTSKLAARDAIIPAYNEYVEDQRQTNPKLAADWTPKVRDLNAYLLGLARGRKGPDGKPLAWKVPDALIDELVYKLDHHDDAHVATYVLYCTDGQGKYTDGPRKGQDRPALTPNYDGYLRWLPTRGDYGRNGVLTPTAKAARLLADQESETNKRRQLTTTAYVPEGFDPTADNANVPIEQLKRQAHDIERALILIKDECDKTDEGRKAWAKAIRDFNEALKGKKA